MKPLVVDVIAYAPTLFYHCTHCEVVWRDLGLGRPTHRDQAASALPADLRQEYARLSAWVHDLADRYGERIQFRLTDAASLVGFFRSLRYRAGKHPTIIVAGQETIPGSDLARAEAAIVRRLREPLVGT
ncbi:MAG: hypothetical protein KatS3mg061_2778 [Dehalococcoidia bacterium]|nr:MAG: hypothetical protein KatS3mg061_2778 [Dehalococcoidia bacterium]